MAAVQPVVVAMRRWGVNVVLAGVTLVFIVALCLEMHVMHSIHAKVHEDAVLSPKAKEMRPLILAHVVMSVPLGRSVVCPR